MDNSPAQVIPGYSEVLIKPDKNEKRSIRKKYTKAGIIILLNILLFNVVLRALLMLGCGIYAGEMSRAGIQAGLERLSGNSFLSTVISVGIPIISQTVSLILGIKWMKISFKGMFSANNYTGGTVVKLTVLSLGLQTAAAVISLIFSAIIGSAGYETDLQGLTADFSSPLANVILFSYACIFGPVLEELLYRGFLLQTLRKYNERMAVFVSALVFGLMHQNYIQFILGFLIGIPLAVVTIKCGSLIPAIVAHIIVNTSNTLFSLWMAYAYPSEYRQIIEGVVIDIRNYSSGFMNTIMSNFAFRVISCIAGLIIGIIAVANRRRHMSLPTPAGKSRGLPVLLTSWAWLLIFAVYIYYDFVQIFI